MCSPSDVKDVADQRNTGAIRISDVSHRYGRGRDEVAALGPVDLTVEPGSFLVLVGASGCGKSTLLRLLAGFESPSEGSVQVSGIAPTPGVTAGVVFQQPRLFPWRTVGGNVDLALKYAKVPRERRAERRTQLLERVGSYEQVIERIQAFHDAGIELFMLQFQPIEDELDRFADKIIPHLR